MIPTSISFASGNSWLMLVCHPLMLFVFSILSRIFCFLSSLLSNFVSASCFRVSSFLRWVRMSWPALKRVCIASSSANFLSCSAL